MRKLPRTINNAGIKFWLEGKGVNWQFIRDEREYAGVAGIVNFFDAIRAATKHMKPVTDAMRKADLI
jgi:hypothetical protein